MTDLEKLLAEVTPGPWGVSGSRIDTVNNPMGIALCFPPLANARLIAMAPTLAAEVVRLRAALSALIDLNDNYSPFGGEMYHDRIDRTWDNARQALDTTSESR